MKKYFLVLTCIFSFLFLNFNTANVNASAEPLSDDGIKMTYEIKPASDYDNRQINIIVSQYSTAADSLKLTELKVCKPDEEGCKLYPYAIGNKPGQDYSKTMMKPVGEPTLFSVTANALMTTTLNYTVKTQTDGDIFILIESRQNESPMPGTLFIVYKLSTLNQRIIVNPDREGRPVNTFDKVQYTASRNNSFKVSLLEDEFDVYSGEIYVCESVDGENKNCDVYSYSNPINYYIRSFGDGKKLLNVYLVKKDTIIENNKFTDANSTCIKKEIVLDTIGPEVNVEGGEWIFVESGKKYQRQGATCKDAVFSNDECEVTDDLDVVGINYSDDGYQFVTYQASDRLGNTTSYVVRVKVEILQKDTNVLPIVLSCTFVLLTTFIILGVVLYKNHQKKKKLSYI